MWYWDIAIHPLIVLCMTFIIFIATRKIAFMHRYFGRSVNSKSFCLLVYIACLQSNILCIGKAAKTINVRTSNLIISYRLLIVLAVMMWCLVVRNHTGHQLFIISTMIIGIM